MTDPITLYDSPGSPCARRVRAVLLEPARHPRVCDWLARLATRPSFRQSEAVRPG